ncbi:MAG TPA: DUF1592 domain-containing protein [Planctomicrobium sp.]|nr:DUF1592 domain-containing protein [Planctomicrobium sp.]
MSLSPSPVPDRSDRKIGLQEEIATPSTGWKFPSVAILLSIVPLLFSSTAHAAEANLGAELYALKCARCHGDAGQGTEDYPDALLGDKSLLELQHVIAATMPEDEEKKCSTAEAEAIAVFMHEKFYSVLAQERNRPATVDFSRLTVRQFEHSVGDLIGTFQWNNPWPAERGLKGEYYNLRSFKKEKLVYERDDKGIHFNFGEAKPNDFPTEPDMEKRRADDIHDNQEFSIKWSGSLLVPKTGDYELIVESENGIRLYFNGQPQAVIDGWVSSGKKETYPFATRLMGGRSYPISLHFFRYKEATSSVVLKWKRAGYVEEVIPERYLTPKHSPGLFVLTTSFPPDDRSIGYERGNAVSKAWQDAVTMASLETAEYVVDRLPALSKIKQEMPDEEKAEKIRQFCRTFVETAFRRPLSEEEVKVYVDAPRAGVPQEIGIKRLVLLTLMSPHFLYRETGFGTYDDNATACWLSYTLWDSLPDKNLRDAATAKKLNSPEQIRQQATRMVSDPRAQAKLTEFLRQWLHLDQLPEIVKNKEAFPGFDAQLASDLRQSLDITLEEFVSNPDGDFRQLLLDKELYANGRMAAFYGFDLPTEATFQKTAKESEKRSGVLTHPLLLAGFAYDQETSPIHRGVFVSRHMLGRRLKPPPEAVSPLAPDLHADLTTRERTILQTSPGACMTCHTMINDLGFPLEQFDATGKYRELDRNRPVDVSGSYLNRDGQKQTFSGGRELAEFIAASPEVHEAFVEQLFQYLVKQPVRAFGPNQLHELTENFTKNNCNVRKLMTEIAVTSALGMQELKKTQANAGEKLSSSSP